jgi:hypothetical protein
VLKLSCNLSNVLPKVLKLSFEVSECKPLLIGLQGATSTDPAGDNPACQAVASVIRENFSSAAVKGDVAQVLRFGNLFPKLGLSHEGRGLHSSTFQLNFSILYGTGGALRGCVARGKGVLGGFTVLRVFSCDRHSSV